MHSTLIVAKMDQGSASAVTDIFQAFDATEMPQRMGTIRRQLFFFKGLYFHLQDFATEAGGAAIEAAKTDPRFQRISADLKPYIEAYDPAWRTPSDAMATRFYDWKQPS